MKRLIFLANGDIDYAKLYSNKSINLDKIVDLDYIIQRFGFMYLEDNFPEGELFISNCPTVLNISKDNKPIWWNDEENKWDIYFIRDYKIVNIQKLTDKELREAHNIEKVYLNGILDND